MTHHRSRDTQSGTGIWECGPGSEECREHFETPGCVERGIQGREVERDPSVEGGEREEG